MKRYLLALIALLIWQPSWAALTEADTVTGNNVTSITMNSSCNVGDLISIMVNGYATTTPSWTATDSLNGAMTLGHGYATFTITSYTQHFYERCTVSGTPTITFNATVGVAGIRITGFTNTTSATYISADTATGYASSGTTLNVAGFAASHANEFIHAWAGTSGNLSSTPTGWTIPSSSGSNTRQAYALGVGQGTTLAYNSSYTSTLTYGVFFSQGFYDSAAVTNYSKMMLVN